MQLRLAHYLYVFVLHRMAAGLNRENEPPRSPQKLVLTIKAVFPKRICMGRRCTEVVALFAAWKTAIWARSAVAGGHSPPPDGALQRCPVPSTGHSRKVLKWAAVSGHRMERTSRTSQSGCVEGHRYCRPSRFPSAGKTQWGDGNLRREKSRGREARAAVRECGRR